MIVKKREVPLYNEVLEALMRRLLHEHPSRKIISESLARRLAGFKGEQAIDYPLSFLPQMDYLIIHDLRLFVQGHYFQIDTLILNQRFFVILEVKNFTGTLFFDSEFNQLIRILNGKEEAFPDPILQLKRQHYQLTSWFKHQSFKTPPIHSFVVISAPRTLLKTSP
ncbi:nuclease-related domain-containing protein [Metabacillus herbersteinensis]